MYARSFSYNNQYKQQGVLTANPVELIVMLYDGCIKNLKIAAMSIDESHDYNRANQSLQKAQEILIELINSLDLSYSIAEDLLGLYEFMLNEIAELNMSKDTTRITPVVEMLSELRQAWQEISKEGRGTIELVDG